MRFLFILLLLPTLLLSQKPIYWEITQQPILINKNGKEISTLNALANAEIQFTIHNNGPGNAVNLIGKIEIVNLKNLGKELGYGI